MTDDTPTVFKEVSVRDIVQITEKARWPGCLAVVKEVRNWGIVAYIQLPGPCEGITFLVDSQQAFVRLSWEEFVLTGGRVQP